MCHQASEFAHVDEGIDCLLNINNFPVNRAWKNYSIEAPTSNIFPSRSSPTSSTIAIDALVVEFNWSKHIIKKKITTLTWYLDAS